MFLALLTSISNVFSLLLKVELYTSNFRVNIKNRRLSISDKQRDNFELIMNMFLSLLACNTLCTLIITSYLLLISDDIHRNPGPNSDVSSSSFCCSDLYNFLNLPNHLCTIHYNVQSIFNKVDTLISEFSCFDVLSFTETRLNDLHSSEDILFPSFQFPERKDRIGDRHGGVILYVINNVAYKRRYDLELNRLENIWVEIKLSSSRNVLYGVFY